VGGQLVALAGLGHAVGLLAVSRDLERFDRAIGVRLRAAGVRVWLVPAGGFAGELLRIAKQLRRLAAGGAVHCAYVRGIWGALAIALSGRRVPYVYDVRGSLKDEMVASGTARYKRWLYLALERWSIRRARSVSAVSRPLAAMVSHEYGRSAVSVVPCCVDVEVTAASAAAVADRRAELGYQDECVLVYSGGLSHYQQVPAMLAIWRALRDDPNVRFLLLTNEDPHKAPQQVGDLADFGSRLRHLSLPHTEVALTLAAADIGFMLRDARELNRVASPVKFPEYLGAGLAVVGSPHTGDASDYIAEFDVGALADPGNLDQAVAAVRVLIARWRTDRNGFRQRGPALVAQRYDWRAYRDTFRAHYGKPRAARAH
ncbi:MAG TPA: glycosyltransferase, partial [Steroidobacteraceae bacterium]|jgi:hypothetical protein|nr:glycosyltransferase [Steroidobacteraceae bacterium]